VSDVCLLFFENDEFVADEVPSQARYASGRSTQETNLV
jgi:hypothetical protein